MLNLRLTVGGAGLRSLPPGYAVLVNAEGAIQIDGQGRALIVKLSALGA